MLRLYYNFRTSSVIFLCVSEKKMKLLFVKHMHNTVIYGNSTGCVKKTRRAIFYKIYEKNTGTHHYDDEKKSGGID